MIFPNENTTCTSHPKFRIFIFIFLDFYAVLTNILPTENNLPKLIINWDSRDFYIPTIP